MAQTEEYLDLWNDDYLNDPNWYYGSNGPIYNNEGPTYHLCYNYVYGEYALVWDPMSFDCQEFYDPYWWYDSWYWWGAYEPEWYEDSGDVLYCFNYTLYMYDPYHWPTVSGESWVWYNTYYSCGEEEKEWWYDDFYSWAMYYEPLWYYSGDDIVVCINGFEYTYDPTYWDFLFYSDVYNYVWYWSGTCNFAY